MIATKLTEADYEYARKWAAKRGAEPEEYCEKFVWDMSVRLPSVVVGELMNGGESIYRTPELAWYDLARALRDIRYAVEITK